MSKVRLLPNVQLEPVVGVWRAWAHLLFPPTYALNVARRYLPSIEAAISGAEAQPDVRKGLRALSVAELIRTRDEVLEENRFYLQLATDLGQLITDLQTKATGQALAPFYEAVPAALRGRVDLHYDLASSANLRFIGPLLYRPPLFHEGLQRVDVKLLHDLTLRPNLRLPRVQRADNTILDLHFAGDELRTMVRAKQEGVPAALLHDILKDDARVRQWTTPDAPLRVAAGVDQPKGVRIRYFGHACVLVESKHCSVLVDPLVAYRCPGTTQGLTFADLPLRIDYALITHAHLDHFDLETLLHLRERIGTIVVPPASNGLIDPSLKDMLKSMGFADVVQLEEFEELAVPGGTISAFPFLGEHSDLNIRAKLTYGVRLHDTTALFLADSLNTDREYFARIRSHLGVIDYLFLGMEAGGSLMSLANGPYLSRLPDPRHDDERRTRANDFDEACGLVETLRPGAVCVYAMGLEPWLWFMFGMEDKSKSKSMQDAERLVAHCRDRGIYAKCLFGREVFAAAVA